MSVDQIHATSNARADDDDDVDNSDISTMLTAEYNQITQTLVLLNHFIKMHSTGI